MTGCNERPGRSFADARRRTRNYRDLALSAHDQSFPILAVHADSYTATLPGGAPEESMSYREIARTDKLCKRHSGTPAHARVLTSRRPTRRSTCALRKPRYASLCPYIRSGQSHARGMRRCARLVGVKVALDGQAVAATIEISIAVFVSYSSYCSHAPRGELTKRPRANQTLVRVSLEAFAFPLVRPYDSRGFNPRPDARYRASRIGRHGDRWNCRRNGC